MSSWAKPGVKCTIIRAANIRCLAVQKYGLRPPVKGQILTISEVRVCRQTGKVLLVFAEVPDVGDNKGWAVEHFRPLVTKTQEEDVAIFKRIADDVPTFEPIT